MKTEREDSDSVQSGEACPFGTKNCALYISVLVAKHAYQENERELRATPCDQNPFTELSEPSSEGTQDCPKWQRPTTPRTSKPQNPEPNFTSNKEQRKEKG